jgi:hypothetical protein
MTQGRNVLSDPLLVGGISRLARNTHVSPAPLDDLLQLLAGFMGWRDAHQSIQFGVKLVIVGPQRSVREAFAPAAGREGCVTGLDGILGVADQMSEADLLVDFGPAHLRGEPIGDPEVRADITEEFLHTSLPRLGRMTKQQSSP